MPSAACGYGGRGRAARAGGFRNGRRKTDRRIRQPHEKAAGQNLQSVILYGSAAAGEFQSEFSNLNLLCILREIHFAKLSAIAPVVEWWHRQKHPAPLVMTQEELERSADVFSIELLDMQQHHRVLFGENVLTGLQIPMQLASRPGGI